jgi:hypothetical protein
LAHECRNQTEVEYQKRSQANAFGNQCAAELLGINQVFGSQDGLAFDEISMN